MSGSVLFHRQRSSEELQLLLAWYKIRDTLLWQNLLAQDIKEALDLASVCEHPNAVWLTKLFAGRDVTSHEEARQVFLGCDNDPRALCFAGFLVRNFEQMRRAADLGDAFAQAYIAGQATGEERFRWAEKSAARGERDGFLKLATCYLDGTGCEEDVESSKDNYSAAAELGNVFAMVCLGRLFGKDDPQRFVWLGRAAANGDSDSFLSEMVDQIRKFRSGTGHAKVVFAIGRALKGHVDNDGETIFGRGYSFVCYIGNANQAICFYGFQLQSYRRAVDIWTIIGLRKKMVKDIRKMIGKMIWDMREEAAYLEDKQAAGNLPTRSNCLVQ
jgi:hypothetical protein